VQPISEPLVRQVLAGFIATPIVGKSKPSALPVEMQLVMTDEGPRLRARVSRGSDQVRWTYTAHNRPYAEFFKKRKLYVADVAWRIEDKPSADADVYKRARQEASQRWWHRL
jgi:hypothetical protein